MILAIFPAGRRWLILLAAAFIPFLVLGCGAAGDAPFGAAKQTWFFEGKDEVGFPVKLKEKPKRIIGVSLGIDEVLLALAPPEHIVALSSSTREPGLSLLADKAKRYPVIMARDPEALLRFQPDLVLSFSTQGAPLEMAATLRDMKVAVYTTRVPRNIDEVFQRIEKIGEVIGEKEKAAALINDGKARLAAVEKKVAAIPKNKRPVILAFSNTKLILGGSGLFNDICRRAGVRNGTAEADLPENAPISKEQVVAINPDIFFLPTWGKEGARAEDACQDIINDPAFRDVKAVKNKRFLYVSDCYRYSNSQFIVDAVEKVAESVYPDLFSR